ncbi:sensor histidine kinase [Nonomuraea spiralis]|uniref:sensor histidine kinase n=1 Tax=Nonomuraea spiralis TaxID=46182 RepID=UPI0037A7B480
MRHETPEPPLTQRLPRGVRTALAWCAVAAGLPLLYAATMADGESLLPVGGAHAAFAVAMAVPLVWARRWPVAVLAVLLAETVAAVALGQPHERAWPLLPAADLVLCLLTTTRTRLIRPPGTAATRTARTRLAEATRTAPAGLVAAVVTLVVQEAAWTAALLSQGLRVLAPGFLAVSVLLGLGVLAAWTAGTALRQRREYGAALRAHDARQAVTAERLRISRDLHDTVAHSIGVIAIQAGAGARVIGSRPEQAREALTAIEETSRQTLRGLRDMLGLLREPPPAGDPGPGAAGPGAAALLTGLGDLDGPGDSDGLGDLDRMAGTVRAAGVGVEMLRRGRPRPLPATVGRCAFRIVQESLTNVVRHAGARHCRVVLDYGDADLRIEVTDDGTPTGTGTTGYGIIGMRERAALLDGDLTAGPCPEGGFRVAATLPLPLPAERLEAR